MKLAMIFGSIFAMTLLSISGDVSQPDLLRPNIVMILADDQGWGDLSSNGNDNLKTPHIDSLARDGARFEHFYVSPVCSPTRAEMLTGRYNRRLGVTGTSAGSERLNLDERTLGDTFKAAGYATGAFGKWHNGTQWPYHPNARGFDEFYGFCSGHWGHYFSPELEHNGVLVKGEGYITDDFTGHAIEFIKQNADTPFVCYLPYNTPHSPMQVPDTFWDRFEDAALEMRHRDRAKEDLPFTRAALAMCENIDWNVGRVLKALDDAGIADNTIVIYFSDNGPNGWRWNADMKGKKGFTDEGGVRSPFFIRWPAQIKPGTRIAELAGAIDLLPTLTELAGIGVDSEKPLDGVSLKPLLLGQATAWPERLYFSAWRKHVSVRSQTHRLDRNGKLYDMTADPGQRTDLAQEMPGLTARLSQAVKDWTRDTNTPAVERPFTVGHPGARVTHLPARDATPHGTIKRSSKHPNCSFFWHWTDTNDSVTWDIDVLTAGTYEATLYYTCKKDNVGARLALSFGENTTEGRVVDAHDPPLVGAAENRVSRGESLVKDFVSMSLGALEMPKAKGVLTLRATEIRGTEAVDVRYIVLMRTDS